MIGKFMRSRDPPVFDQRASPLPIWLPISLSLPEIPADVDGGRDARGGAGGCKIPKDGRGWGRGAGGRSRDGQRVKGGTAGAAKEATEAKDTTTSTERGGWGEQRTCREENIMTVK